MRIGIITFHWATNYGAILQAFALQTYLKKLGYEVSIINYRPKQYKKTLLKCFLKLRFWQFIMNLQEYIKENKLDKFRSKYLHETLLYNSLDELKLNFPKFDAYVTGSDQVWNAYFTTKGEGKPTSAYFLDFGEENVKRIAYAVSFGCEDYPEDASIIAKKFIHNFNAISVREDSGIEIVLKMGYTHPVKLLDPTLLIDHADYHFAFNNETLAQKTIFTYVLRDEGKEIKRTLSLFKKKFKIVSPDHLFNPYTIEEWLGGIKNASIVITNSFHGMVFSIIFHIPFIVLSSKGTAAGMNDRFKTLLNYLNLQHRIINSFDSEKLMLLLDENINWDNIDNQLIILKKESMVFFKNCLNT